MICECGARLQWRCTDTKTKMAKYKCPQCGEVVLAEDKWKPVHVEHREPKYYYFSKGRFNVQRKMNGGCVGFGCYGNEETAKKVVDKLKECDWDKSQLLRIYDELHIERVNRSWVCV